MIVLAFTFLLTVALEWPVLAWFSKLGFARTGWFCLCMNGVTWGAAMAVLTLWPLPVPAVEAAIIVIEAVILRWFWDWHVGRAFAAAVAMNLTSWLLGAPLVLVVARLL